MTAPATMPDDHVREGDPRRRGKEVREHALDCRWVALGRPAQALGQSDDMRVNGQGWHAEPLGEHDTRRLPAHPRQRHQVVHRGWHLATEALAEHLADATQAHGLLPEQPGRGDDPLQVGEVARGIGRNRWIGAKELWSDGICSSIRRLRAEDRRHEEIQGRREVQFAPRLRVALPQGLQHVTRLAGRRG